MKFCTKCGEVYPSEVENCNVDGAALEVWTRTFFEAKDDPEDLIQSDDSDLGIDEDAEVTNVETMPCESPPGMAMDEDLSSTMEGEASANTAVVDIRAPVTLTEFDVHSEVGQIDTGDELVCYDDEVSGPFQGMLISNRYRLESRIGTGGFGVVFDAYDKEENKRVAVKVLSPALSEDKRALLRFRREAIAVSRLKHPGIVSISDFGIEDEGVSYIVMEFLPGRDLAVLLEDERYLSARRAATLVMQCAEALSAAHVEGVLHRDLKPANIFVVHDESLVERIKIIDFGIAKDRSSNPRMKDITAASKVVGTPFYMSPEQASGHELDGRADVYSLGVILYELLTGQRPFQGASVYDILMAHSTAKRVRPSKLRAELRGEDKLDQIVLRAIAARRDDRFPSMDVFAEALREYLQVGAIRHASASSLRFDSSLEGIRPSRQTALDGPSSEAHYHRAPRRFPLPLWSVLIPAVAIAVGAGVIRADYGEGTAEALEAAESSQVGAPEPPPLARSSVSYTAVRDEIKSTTEPDAGMSKERVPDADMSKERVPDVGMSKERVPDVGMSKESVKPPETNKGVRSASGSKKQRRRMRRAARARAQAPKKEKGIEEW